MRYSSWYWPSAPLRICCLRCRVASRSSGWTKSRPASKLAAASASPAPRIFRNCGERSVRLWATSYSCTPNCAASAAVRSCASLRRNAADPSSMSRRARRSASLTALTSRTRELPMMNGSPRPKAPAAAVVAASGRVRPRPNRKARPMTRPPTNRRVAPQNRRESFSCLSTNAAGKATSMVQSDHWPRPTAARTSSPSIFRVRTTLPGGSWASRGGTAVPTSRAWSRRRAMMTPLLSQMAADQPSGRLWLCSSARRSSGTRPRLMMKRTSLPRRTGIEML